MPTFQTFNLLIFLATVIKATRSQSLKLSSSSLYDTENSDNFPRSPNEIGAHALSRELESTAAKYSDALDEKTLLAIPLYSPLRKSYRPKLKPVEVISNEIEDISREPNPYSRYMLLTNIIPKIPTRSRLHKDPITQYFDKMRKVKAIKEAFRQKNKKQRAKIAFAKAISRMKPQKDLDGDNNLEGIRQPRKFRRAKILPHSQKFHVGRHIPNFKSSPSLSDRPIAQDFRQAPHISVPASQLENLQPLSASSPIMFPSQTGTHSSVDFGPKAEPLTMGNGPFFVKSSPPFTPSHRHPSRFSHSLSSLPPFQKSEFFDLPMNGNPSALSQPLNSGSVFYGMPATGHLSSVAQPPSPGSVSFQEGFHSFSVPFDGIAKDTQPPQSQEAFPSSDTWGAGEFVADDSDCADIKGKPCQTDLDCSCFGFYTCMAESCHNKQIVDTQGSQSQPRVNGWHDQPVDFGFVKRQGLEPYRLYSRRSRDKRSTRRTSLSAEQNQGRS